MHEKRTSLTWGRESSTVKEHNERQNQAESSGDKKIQPFLNYVFKLLVLAELAAALQCNFQIFPGGNTQDFLYNLRFINFLILFCNLTKI